MIREEFKKRIRSEEDWDIVIIGGGASGLGVALDASLRGYKTLLLEIKDFASATSSRSTKLVHGGVRYLQQGNVGLVKEALRERGRLADNASHLVRKLPFIIPNYRWWKGVYYWIGLSIYDLLAGKGGFGKTKFLSKGKTIEKLPTIKRKGLKNGILYYDGQFDDARLAVNLMQTSIENGGVLLNYMGVKNLIKDENNKVRGVIAKDEFTDEEFTISSKVVVNATGIFTDDILNMDNPDHGKMVIPSQGIHLVFDESFLPKENAIMIPKTSDGRVLFAVPWHNKTVVGTTDTLLEKEEWEPRALEEEIKFILQTAQAYMQKTPHRNDVKAVFAGLRPLAAPKNGSKNTKEVSRSHKIVFSKSNLASMIGGKWTTYRQMAEDCLDKIIAKGFLPNKECKTQDFPIHGKVPAEQVDMNHRIYVYGSDISHIRQLQKEDSKYAAKIHPEYEITFAEVLWGIKEEMAQTVDDILARRTRLLVTDAKAAVESAKPVAEFMAAEMGKSEEWVETQVMEFKKIAENYSISDF